MIRPGPGIPLIYRLHMRAQLTADRMSRACEMFRKELHNDLAVARAFPANLLGRARALRRDGAVHQPQPMDVLEFEARFDDLIGLLCGAAQDLLTDEDRRRYVELRVWLAERYGRVRPLLLPYLAADTNDLSAPVSDGLPRHDAFESLFAADSLDESIHSPTVIERIVRTRMALESFHAAQRSHEADSQAA